MKNKFTFFILSIFFCSCNISGWKRLDFRVFYISVPNDWQYKKTPSFDSFAGQIVSKNVILNFDYSKQGYANSLIPTKQEFLNVLWLRFYTHPSDADEPFYMPEGEKLFQFASTNRQSTLSWQHAAATSGKKQNDTTITFIDVVNTKRYKDSIPDYNAIIKFNGETDTVPVYIPIQIKQQNITVDTAGKYVTKTIWPKVAGRGMTRNFCLSHRFRFYFYVVRRKLNCQGSNISLKSLQNH